MKKLNVDFINHTISEATLRTEDLIPAFMGFLTGTQQLCETTIEVLTIQEEVDTLQLEDKEGYGKFYIESDLASVILIEDIFDLMNEIAPEGCYFGTHEGDGTCFGFWTDEELVIERVLSHLDDIDPFETTLEEVKDTINKMAASIAPHMGD